MSAMSRSGVEQHLRRELGELLAFARVAPADIAGGLKEPIDDAFRAVERAGQSTIPSGSITAALAEGEYRTLLRIHRAILLIPGEDDRKARMSDIRFLLDAARDAAKATKAESGAGVGGFGVGRIQHGYLARAEDAE